MTTARLLKSVSTAHHTKAAPTIYVKALGEAGGVGEVSAFVSVFDNRDHYGDIVRRGAYLESIDTAKAVGGWPIVFAHQHTNPDSILGKTFEMAEVYPGDARIPADAPAELKAGGGLWVAGGIDGVKEAGSFAAKLWSKMTAGLIKQWSFAYDIIDGGEITMGERWAYELRKLLVLEVGPCLFGVNDATMTLATKARAGGRRELAKALELIDAVANGEALDLPLDLDLVMAELGDITSAGSKADTGAGITRAELAEAVAEGFAKAVALLAPPATTTPAATGGDPAATSTPDPATPPAAPPATTATALSPVDLVEVFAAALELETIDC